MVTAAPNPDPAGSRRIALRLPRPLWMGVTAIVLIILAVGLQFGLPAYFQHLAILEIERLGGQVETRPRGPQRLRDAMGAARMRSFDDVVEVRLRDTQANDATLVHVGRLAGLQRLWIANTQLTDAGLVHLHGLTRLEELSLAETKVTDAGLLQLKGLSRLRWLYLGSTQISPAAVAELERLMPELRVFR